MNKENNFSVDKKTGLVEGSKRRRQRALTKTAAALRPRGPTRRRGSVPPSSSQPPSAARSQTAGPSRRHKEAAGQARARTPGGCPFDLEGTSRGRRGAFEGAACDAEWGGGPWAGGGGVGERMRVVGTRTQKRERNTPSLPNAPLLPLSPRKTPPYPNGMLGRPPPPGTRLLSFPLPVFHPTPPPPAPGPTPRHTRAGAGVRR